MYIKYTTSNYEYEPNADYFVFSETPARRSFSLLEEAITVSKTIYEQSAGERPIICMSGGIDSEAMAFAFRHSNVPFEAVIWRYNDHMNDFDIKFAVEYCVQHQITFNFFDFDAIGFFESGKYLEYANTYRVISPQLCVHLAILESADRPFVLAAQPPFGKNEFNEIVPCLVSDLYFSYNRFASANKRTIFPHFFMHSPEIIRAFKNLSLAQSVLNTKLDNFYNFKVKLYNEGGIKVQAKPQKFTGFEKLKIYFAENSSLGPDAFNIRFRYPLQKMFPIAENHASVFL